MKKWIFGLLLPLLTAAPPLAAQVVVEVEIPQEQLLSGEPVQVAAKVKNLSGQTLHLGGEEDWLVFSVETQNGGPVREKGAMALRSEFSLDSASVATRRADLEPYFNLTRPGRYKVTAQVKIPGWEKPVVSKARTFDIITGTKVWEQSFGVPSPITDTPPSMRKFTLLQANYLKHLRLYLRVTEGGADDELIKLMVLGPLTSFSKPECQMDKFNNLHVLHQSGSKSFGYVVATPDGDILARQTHYYTETRPILKPAKDGQVLVVGGYRQPTASDVPPATSTPARNAQK